MGVLALYKQSMQNFISRGRPGFPKSLGSLPRIGLSTGSRSVQSAIMNSASQVMGTISSAGVTTSEISQTQILATRSSTPGPSRKKVTLKNGNGIGSLVDLDA